MKTARQTGSLVIGSPPGTGKTSLSLMQLKLRKENEQAVASGEEVSGFYLRPSQTKT